MLSFENVMSAGVKMVKSLHHSNLYSVILIRHRYAERKKSD